MHSALYDDVFVEVFIYWGVRRKTYVLLPEFALQTRGVGLLRVFKRKTRTRIALLFSQFRTHFVLSSFLLFALLRYGTATPPLQSLTWGKCPRLFIFFPDCRQ